MRSLMNEWNSHGNMLVKRSEKPVNYTNMKSQRGFWNETRDPPESHKRVSWGSAEIFRENNNSNVKHNFLLKLLYFILLIFIVSHKHTIYRYISMIYYYNLLF